MGVETGLSPALTLKPTCVGKMCNFVILKRLNNYVYGLSAANACTVLIEQLVTVE